MDGLYTFVLGERSAAVWMQPADSGVRRGGGGIDSPAPTHYAYKPKKGVEGGCAKVEYV